MAVLDIEDLTGNMEVVVFPKTYTQVSELLEPDQILVFEGKIEERGDQTQMLLDTANPNLPGIVNAVPIVDTVVIDVTLSGDQWKDVGMLQEIADIMRDFEGEHPLELQVLLKGEMRPFKSRSIKVDWSPGFIEAIEALTGQATVRKRTLKHA